MAVGSSSSSIIIVAMAVVVIVVAVDVVFPASDEIVAGIRLLFPFDSMIVVVVVVAIFVTTLVVVPISRFRITAFGVVFPGQSFLDSPPIFVFLIFVEKTKLSVAVFCLIKSVKMREKGNDRKC